jgi:adenosine deaminase
VTDTSRDFALGLPKAELHLHLEGTLEPELLFRLAHRNNVILPYADVDAVRAAYDFSDLQSFLDLYYAGCAVLVTEQDFYDLTRAYLSRIATENVRHTEVFFDPQTHTARGVPFETVADGILAALSDGEQELGITWRLIMSFLRDLPAEGAAIALESARPYGERICGIGLDSAEWGHPPEDFAEVYAEARRRGYRTVAHAGEEGPPEYVSGALDALGAERIEHGVRSLEDPELVERLARDRIPLTMCPLSNLRLHVITDMAAHPLKRMMDAGITVTVNSDDPAYFGGYITDNYVAAAGGLGLTRADLVTLAENSFAASFLDDDAKAAHVAEVRRYAAQAGL